jgi:hypothetical protein
VVSLGTPHRGSHFANDATRWLSRKLISIPTRMIQGQQALLRDNPEFFRPSTTLEIKTSIDSLAPGSPFLNVLVESPPGPWVTFHNIMGNVPQQGLVGRFASEGDGVVSLASARLSYAQSEIVVPADHSHVHRHPRSVLEVRRILLEHLDSLRSFPATVQRLPVTAEKSIGVP